MRRTHRPTDAANPSATDKTCVSVAQLCRSGSSNQSCSPRIFCSQVESTPHNIWVHVSTLEFLGNGLQALLADPASWQCLQREPALLPGAVREPLRFDSPVQYTGRRVAADLVLHGRQLRRGDLVVALIASANRDPARHAEPDRLDVARRGSGLLSFGAGAHVCIGASLTLMEAEIVFGRLLRRWPRLSLVDTQPQWSGNAVYRGLSALPVRQILAVDCAISGPPR